MRGRRVSGVLALLLAGALADCGQSATIYVCLDGGQSSHCAEGNPMDSGNRADATGSGDSEVAADARRDGAVRDGGARSEAGRDASGDVADGGCGLPSEPCCKGGICEGTLFCQSGVCGCPDPLSACGDECVNEQADLDNCGGCGLFC